MPPFRTNDSGPPPKVQLKIVTEMARCRPSANHPTSSLPSQGAPHIEQSTLPSGSAPAPRPVTDRLPPGQGYFARNLVGHASYTGFTIAFGMNRRTPPPHRVDMEELFQSVLYGETDRTDEIDDCGDSPADGSLPSIPPTSQTPTTVTSMRSADHGLDLLASPGETTAIGDFDDAASPATEAPSLGAFSFAPTLVGGGAQGEAKADYMALGFDVASAVEAGTSAAVRPPALPCGGKRKSSPTEEPLDDTPSPKRICLDFMHVSPHMVDGPRSTDKIAAVQAWVHTQPSPQPASLDPPSPILPFEPSPPRQPSDLPLVSSSPVNPSPIELVDIPQGFEEVQYKEYSIYRAVPLPNARCPLPDCDSMFAYSKADCGIHLQQAHNISRSKHATVPCPHAPCSYSGNAKDFGRHFITHVEAEGPTFWCQFCKQVRRSRDLSDMGRHMTRAHPLALARADTTAIASTSSAVMSASPQ